jgi:hypothetical protein
MKNSITFLLILMAFSISEVKAQQSDSTARLPVMKKKSQIFIAEILTDIGLQKGVFYRADSIEVVILDSMFHAVSIPLKSIKTIKLRRSNALGYNFLVGFLATEGLTAAIAILLAYDGLAKYFLLSFAVGVPLGLLVGTFLLVVSTAPNMTIHYDRNPRSYFKQLKIIQAHTQTYLLQQNARIKRRV